MKNYCIRSNPGSTDYLSVVNETEEGFMVRIYRDLDGYVKTIDEFMSHMLFESCVRTGYLIEIAAETASATA